LFLFSLWYWDSTGTMILLPPSPKYSWDYRCGHHTWLDFKIGSHWNFTRADLAPWSYLRLPNS
jgi:hypothetical protein